MTEIPERYRGWWRIVETSAWASDDLDMLGPALISLNGADDRLRMHCLLANVTCLPARSGVAFAWNGAWEFDPVSGTGEVKLGRDGRLRGIFRIEHGDSSELVAERSSEPERPIPDPPSYRDKWRRRY